jgi:hypothetical protein
MNFLAGGSRYFAPADSDLNEWTQVGRKRAR